IGSTGVLKFFTVSSILVLWNPHRGGPSGLATPIFSLSSLEPKSLRMIILTLILVQVLCCLYQSPKHYIEIWHERPFLLQHCSNSATPRNTICRGSSPPPAPLQMVFLGAAHPP